LPSLSFTSTVFRSFILLFVCPSLFALFPSQKQELWISVLVLLPRTL
jgi:hypothetical protein